WYAGALAGDEALPLGGRGSARVLEVRGGDGVAVGGFRAFPGITILVAADDRLQGSLLHAQGALDHGCVARLLLGRVRSLRRVALRGDDRCAKNRHYGERF